MTTITSLTSVNQSSPFFLRSSQNRFPLPFPSSYKGLRNSTRFPSSSIEFVGKIYRAMPLNCSKEVDNGALSSFKLNESTFLASLMPKKEIGADRFIESNPNFDGRGALIAIFDSGVDPAAAGLQVTTDGKPKILDVLDCTGSGDVDTSKVVKADEDGVIMGASGAPLVVNSSWKNPTGDWHVGYKMVYELFTDTLTSRLKKERKKKWDEKNQEAIAEAVKQLQEFDQKYVKVEDINLKRTHDDLQNKVDYLRKQGDSYDDRGPVIDAVVWNDGDVWRVALDTQSLEDDQELGKLANFSPLTNYRTERKYGIFSKLDACSFVTNVYDEGKILSIVTDCSPHGTHVAGIATAFHPNEPLLNGVAPGAQLISCKIGDARLGSMETGTGLSRALIAAVEHKCDLINMSYGEDTLLPDYGRFIDLVNEAVNKHRLIFISSAGNSGPALNTVGAPGGTTSSIIGVGAYVSPAMAAGAHCVVEPPAEGLEYTWSSRGPTADGDLGVCISAPGGAVAPVPTWTLQRRMLMNGTSMASPSACGGVALLISAMKAEGITVSPYTVRRALENTANSVGGHPEDKLSTGQGLMQVDKALEYIQQSRNTPCVRYQITINQSGKTTPKSRGIYLREASACQKATEWTVQVEPMFHEDASNLEQLVPFEECLQLHTTENDIIQAPEYLLLTNNGRTFNIVVDPTKLKDGVHYFELYGVDCKAPSRGPLFRVPITITKPIVLTDKTPLVAFSGMRFVPGHIERRFIEVPRGANWVEATMRTSGFDTARRFFIDTLQICPLKRPMKWERVETFSSPSAKSFSFPVEGGQTMELAVAQFWSSGIGSQEITIADFEIEFHGISINKETVVLDGSDAPVRVDATALLSCEKLVPAATLNKIRIPYRPSEAKFCTLPTDRDKLVSGKQILALTLTYKFKLDDGAEIKPVVPLLNGRVYDNKFESQFYMISDSNKRVYATGDVYPKSVKLPKGDYNLQLYLRHDNVQYLEKMKQLVLFIEKKLEEKDFIRLSFYSQPDGPVMGNGSFKSSDLVPGTLEAFYVAPPTKDKLPKNCPAGSVLLGAISYKKPSPKGKQIVSYEVSFVVPPTKVDEKPKDSSPMCTKSVLERLTEEVRDAKVSFLGSVKHGTEEERCQWNELTASLKSDYPNYTPLLSKIMECLLSESKEDKIVYNEELIDAANEVVDSVDKDELLKFFSVNHDPEDDKEVAMKKKMEATRDQLVEALYQKGLSLYEIDSLKGGKVVKNGSATEGFYVVDKSTTEYASDSSDKQEDLFEKNFKELKRWVDVKPTSKYGKLLVLHERRLGRLGTALKVVSEVIQNDDSPPKKQLYDMKISLLEEIGWEHLASYEKQWMHIRFPPSLPLF
ncbi:tripeptidyl-peptidase 2-like isoform X1 [Papaver somniferum]|uniref:tripeptidyl-peptidase 2-like isoform X1 n=1 Tax=Papaver somniferum TaxID=3469 RepID=UPI000E6F8A85|nr:tripeptidyl-peptidase 2-like isoform X1 [Papaver somniferum]